MEEGTYVTRLGTHRGVQDGRVVGEGRTTVVDEKESLDGGVVGVRSTKLPRWRWGPRRRVYQSYKMRGPGSLTKSLSAHWVTPRYAQSGGPPPFDRETTPSVRPSSIRTSSTPVSPQTRIPLRRTLPSVGSSFLSTPPLSSSLSQNPCRDPRKLGRYGLQSRTWKN